ncbi:MAG TPA: ASKHA domain-containing protein [Candidatus Limnocylindria bacterium]|nr:ASKHA domain-containing protein [Candidatus Limnocylindria bacterium]
MPIALVVIGDPRHATSRRELTVAAGTSILKAAHAGGVDITATCGGRGRCTSCRVKFIAGTIPPPTIMDEVQLGHDLVREGYRLACQCAVVEPLTVQVAPPIDEQAFQILGPGTGPPAGVSIDAGVVKRLVAVALPREEHHQTSDLEQLALAAGVEPAQVGTGLLAALPDALRGSPDGTTVTTFGTGAERRLIAVERGDTTSMKFGLAIDIGTTSVVTTLIELESGERLASVSSLNPQAVFGGDLMSRIAFAQFNPGNLRKLHTRIVGLLNRHVEQVCRESGVLAKWIYKAVVVGNTCMHHILLGIDPSHVGLAPYAPVMRHPLALPARELFLKIAPEARVCLLPIVAGFVGADAVAVALATRIGERPDVRIAVDIGTNGEVILGSSAHLWAASAPAGPALEGAQIRHGMRGAQGAIDRATVAGDIAVHTIGDSDALGICGSGLIDLVAGLLDAGVIDCTGLIDVDGRERLPPALRDRVVMRGEERQVIVLRAGEAGARQEIVLTQDDVRQVQLCKGAIASGIAMLQHVAGFPDDKIDELMLAGGFGNYLSIPSAVRIGLIPPLPNDRIRYVGNAASLGAQICLLSEPERARATALAARIEHVSLAAHPDFETIFVDAMNFPRA